jgi:hypothetical protein
MKANTPAGSASSPGRSKLTQSKGRDRPTSPETEFTHPDLVLWQLGTNSVIHDHKLSDHDTSIRDGLKKIRSWPPVGGRPSSSPGTATC